MRGMRRIRVGMQGMECKCKKSGWRYENLGIAVEMT